MITIYKGGKLVDGKADQVLENALVVVEGKTIAFAGPYSAEKEKEWADKEGAKVVQLEKDQTVMPGLIDAHIHLTLYGQPSSVMHFLTDSSTYTALKALTCAQKCLDAGFTTVRSVGDKSEADFAVKRAINEGLFEGPRVLASGKAISITGGHGDFVPGDVQLDTIGETCDGVEEVRRAARKRLKNNADNIKLMATGGGNSPGPGTVAQLSVEEMKAAVEEANRRGNIVTSAHCIGTEGINNALKAGVRTIEHGSFLDDESIELFLKGEHYLVPTLVAFRTIEFGEQGGVPPYVIEKVKYFATQHYANLEKAVKAGVKVVCGTDTGTPFNYHGEAAEELERYTQHGLSPMQAIKSATSVAAEALYQKDIGTLEAGKTADLLVVDGDPVADIKLLQKKENLRVIMRNGKAYKDTLQA